MKDLVAVGEKLGVTLDYKTAGALAISLQNMRDACKDEATSQVGPGAWGMDGCEEGFGPVES